MIGYLIGALGGIIAILCFAYKQKVTQIQGLKIDNTILKSNSERAPQEAALKQATDSSLTALEDYRAKKKAFDALVSGNGDKPSGGDTTH